MTDTHTHPYLEDFSDGGANAVRRALAAGVTRLILPNVDAGTVKPLNALHERFPDSTFMAMGLHPTEVAENWRIVMENLEAELHTSAYVAVGE
ncbi:MAG: TatD family hydrolase, partial [Muribaculaceae bacterium]|nr:TatD family hydrolase [Muribaculaceae bacterium]